MKSRSKELLDRAVSAMGAAIEVYNKPGFPYRTESFAILAVNAWELLLKAKRLEDNNNKLNCIYVYEPRTKLDGTKSKNKQIKRTRSGNPFTHSLDYLAKSMVEDGSLAPNAWENLQAVIEFRDSAIHFYHQALDIRKRVQEIGAGCVSNFVVATRQWFEREISELDLFLMPLSLVHLPTVAKGVMLNPEERNFVDFLATLSSKDVDPASDYSVAVNFEVRVTKSKSTGAAEFRKTNNPDAPEMRITEEQIREMYPWSYKQLTDECKKRFQDFSANQKYHDIRKPLQEDEKFAKVRYLDPTKKSGMKKTFYNPNILKELGKHYKTISGGKT